MKKAFLFIVLMFGCAVFAQNQGEKKPKGKPNQEKKEKKGPEKRGEKPSIEERAERASQKWQKELGLTEQQRQSFKTAKISQLEKKRAAIENSKGDRKQLGAEMQTINQEFRNSIKTAWGDEKYNQWVAKKKEMAKKAKEMKGKNKANETQNTPSQDVLLDDEDDGVE